MSAPATPAAPLSASAETARDLVVVDVSHQSVLQEKNVPVIWKGSRLILAEWTEAEQSALISDVPFQVIAHDVKDETPLYLVELNEDEALPVELTARVLYRKGIQAVVMMTPEEADSLSGGHLHGIHLTHRARGWERPLSFVPFSCGFNATTNALLSRTSQSEWLDWIEKMSGYEPVDIGGSQVTIATRNSSTTFTNQPQAKGYDYLKQVVQAWHYGAGPSTIEEDPYTGTGGQTWKNMVLTIPGQTLPNEIVVMSAHYDSTSGSPTTLAPGADDNGTGSAAVFEAARLMRQFRFQRTIKLIWFTGEEQGLFGSEAYVADHPMSPIVGVVNYDMGGYDSNGDRCMEIHMGTLSQSQDVGNCFRDSIGAYGLNLLYDYLTTGATDRSDHASFWQANVGAIELAENFFNDGLPGGCSGSDANPAYHTVNDKLPTNLMPSFGFDIGRTAIATVSGMAIPLQACFANAPAPTVTPHATSVDLAWPALAGATSYRIYRSTLGCGGPWAEIAQVGSASYTDSPVTQNSTYNYYVEAVASDNFCVSAPSPCLTVVPTGPSVVYQPNSATILADSGDSDGIADNCELITLRANLLNNGSEPLSNLKIQSLTSTFPGIQIVTQIPQEVAPSLAIGASVPVTFKFYLGRTGGSASCGVNLTFNIVLSSDQTSTTTTSFSVSVERNPSAPLNYTFDTDFSGWTVTSGSFTRSAGGAPGSTPFSVRTPNIDNACAAIQSPVVIPTAQSALTLWVNYGINGTTSDRAVVRAINQATLEKTLLIPSGAVYTTTAPGPAGCDGIGSLQGWAGEAPTWRQATFDLSSFAGAPIRIEVRYISDTQTVGSQGFWFDAVQITNPRNCDSQANACSALPEEVSPAGAVVPFTIAKNGAVYDLRFSEVVGATGYNIYGGTLSSLHGGFYDHASAMGICALADGAAGDGQVLASVASGAFPENGYLLAVAKNASGESVYGHRSSGPAIPLALAGCP